MLRHDIIMALFACGGGHYGGSLSVIDILLTLYRTSLRVVPAEPLHPLRDRCILSKGHAAIALYAVLRRLGFFDEPLENYGRADSILEGHPDMLTVPGVDFSTGSLGQGLSVGVGMALALRESGSRVWVILGDGECQEGQIWEAAMLAARYRLGNLHVIVDMNMYQEWGWSADPSVAPEPVENMAAKWEAFGWSVKHADGHDHAALADVMAAAVDDRPSVIVARTVKGKGFPLIEADPIRFHCATILDDEHALLLQEGI